MRSMGLGVILWAMVLPAQAFECPAAPAGLQDIKAFGYYTDDAKSIRDEARFKETHALTKPFEDFARQIATLSDRYLAQQDTQAGDCTVAWLDRWAQDRAMLGEMVRINNDQSEYVRAWTNATDAVVWNKVRTRATPEQRQRIDAWLQQVSWASLAYWDRHPKAKRNNHYYWTGVGGTAAAVASGDEKLLAAARQVYEAGIQDIQDDGVLPMEMQRGVRALHYHNYAAMPLVMMAEMARKRGEDWFAFRDGRLDRLAARIATGLRDPAWFEQAAHAAPQVIPPSADYAWVQIYRARRPQGERFDGIALIQDDQFQRDLGGRLSLMLTHGVFDPDRAAD